MSLATIKRMEMSREEALVSLSKYRAAVREGDVETHPWAQEDKALLAAYRALSKGRPVIDLREAIMHGGVFGPEHGATAGLPRFAVCRADARRCEVTVRGNGGLMFTRKGIGWRCRQFLDRQNFGDGTVPNPEPRATPWSGGRLVNVEPRGETLVPMVPAPLRPAHKLSGYLTLWEVEKWAPVPPVDPMLLKWLGSGFLCAVVAVWNLTPLERAAMRGAMV